MGPVLTPDVLRFGAILFVAATWLLVQADLSRRTVTAKLLSPFQRMLCLLPPVAVYYAFRLGARRKALLCVALCLVYLALRASTADTNAPS